MKIQIIIIIITFIIITLITISLIKTIINKSRVDKILIYLNKKSNLKFYAKNCYSSSFGLKKEYPSYPCKLEIYLTENEIVFIGKNNFLFIFKTIENPFILCKNPIELKEKIDIKRIFKPIKITLNEKTLNLFFIDNHIFDTSIEYQIELEQSDNLEKIKNIYNWC